MVGLLLLFVVPALLFGGGTAAHLAPKVLIAAAAMLVLGLLGNAGLRGRGTRSWDLLAAPALRLLTKPWFPRLVFVVSVFPTLRLAALRPTALSLAPTGS
jgi:hypothetical protein